MSKLLVPDQWKGEVAALSLKKGSEMIEDKSFDAFDISLAPSAALGSRRDGMSGLSSSYRSRLSNVPTPTRVSVKTTMKKVSVKKDNKF